ncbi:MAG: hypothetical protein IJN80_00155 [Clostridia bacterium]|nr:hypothetical protein [Clostridia bacterium]
MKKKLLLLFTLLMVLSLMGCTSRQSSPNETATIEEYIGTKESSAGEESVPSEASSNTLQEKPNQIADKENSAKLSANENQKIEIHASFVTQKEAEQLAEKYLSETYGPNLKAVEAFVEEDDGNFNIFYDLKYGKDGFFRGPRIAVRVLCTGKTYLAAFSNKPYEDFDERLLEDITYEKLYAYTEAKLKELLGDQLISFKIDSVKVAFQDDRYLLEIYYIKEWKSKEDDPFPLSSGEILQYELS